MIKQNTKLVNQLLPLIHFDSADKSVIRIAFDGVLKVLSENDLIVPQKAYEETLNKVLNERLVGKIQASEPTKYVIAQAMLNTAYLLAVSKDDIIKHKIKTNQV
jgi:hypothetical protein